MTKQHRVLRYVRDSVHVGEGDGARAPESSLERLTEVFVLLPPETLELFLSGQRSLCIKIFPTPRAAMGLRTTCTGPPSAREYTIILYQEHFDLPRDHFIGAVLRELGHVVANMPPEHEWPVERSDRAEFRENLETRADALVWQWGLKEYSLAYLHGTFPPHWVERIVKDIQQLMKTWS